MSQRYARIPIITEPLLDQVMVVEAINARISEINRVFEQLELEQSKLEGTDNNVPVFRNNINLNNNRVTGAARSKDPQDCVTRRELEEIGILGNRADGINITGDLTVDGSITVTGGSGGSSEIPTSDSIVDLIDDAIGAELATSNDGEVWAREDAAGVNGSQGTVSMGVDGSGKARPVELRNGELAVQDHEIHTLLHILIEEVRKLRDAN